MKTASSEKTQVFQSICSSLLIHYRQVGTAQDPVTARRKMNTLQGRARWEICRRSAPWCSVSWREGGGRGQRHQNWQRFPFYKRRMTSWVDLQSPKGLCWWGNFIPRTRRPSVNINMQASSAWKQHGQSYTSCWYINHFSSVFASPFSQ